MDKKKLVKLARISDIIFRTLYAVLLSMFPIAFIWLGIYLLDTKVKYSFLYYFMIILGIIGLILIWIYFFLGICLDFLYSKYKENKEEKENKK